MRLLVTDAAAQPPRQATAWLIMTLGDNMIRLPIATVAAFLFAFAACNAHQEAMLGLDGEQLSGLPEEFLPAEFSWEGRFLRVGAIQVDLNAFENVIPLNLDYSASVTASWYHSKEIMPFYIGINLRPKDMPFWYTILFNLETMELLKVTIRYHADMEKYVRSVYHEIALRDTDLERIKRRTKIIE